MSKTTIADTRIRLRPSKKILEFIDENVKHVEEIPENVAKVMKFNGYELPEHLKTLDPSYIKKPKIDKKLLKELIEEYPEDDSNSDPLSSQENKTANELAKDGSYLYLNDLKWLNNFMTQLRKEHGLDVFLHELIETGSLILPENEIIERNPELEARCQKLREQQQNLEYYKMTKNVDSTLIHYPEDTIAYQLKTINSQIVAVLQFVVSVLAGFAFGFFGIQMMIGNLDFGFRLLLGVMCALVIALAEMYFLAKKLVEYDTAVDTKITDGVPKRNQKVHKD